jgi:hypothetical protein
MKKFTVCAAMVCAAVAQSGLAEDTPRLHPLEAACIDYDLTGQMLNGKVTRCHREYAYESYEIQDADMSFGGFKQKQHQNTIVIGNVIYVIDLPTQTGTKSVNPMYDKILASLEGKSPEEMGQAFMTSMGFTPTGETKNIAGHDCKVSSSSMLGTVCMTDDALMLEQSVMGNTRTATRVNIGEGGAEENYTQYTQVPLSDGPDLSKMPDLQKLMNPPKQQ